ncbi:efflux RND transporter periplasmic adaptor subunit, partial [Roseivivax sp. CAU 1761]
PPPPPPPPPRAGIQGIEARISSAEAAVARARDEIEKLTLRAPFAGVLESDTAELGTLMQSGGMGGAACATILALDPIRLVGFVPETMLHRVATGAEARAELAEGGEVAGQVVFVSRRADTVTRTFRVEIEAPNPDLAIRAGQTAEISIAAPGALAHLLPQSTLTLDDAGRLGLRAVAEDGSARFHAVEILRDTVDGVWLTGLPETLDVITVGQEYVTDGVSVEPVFEPVLP